MKHFSILTLFLLLISICCFLSCDKKPTDPDPEDAEHLFYISAAYGADSSIVKIFSVEQLQFIDSLIIDDFRIGAMAVIGNNEMLIVSEGYRTRVYDLETKDMFHSADGYGYPLQISPNSEYCHRFDIPTHREDLVTKWRGATKGKLALFVSCSKLSICVMLHHNY